MGLFYFDGMKVFSVGDKLEKKFNIKGVHSCFEHAVNIITDIGLVSIVSKEIGGGPNNIVVEEIDTFNDLNSFDTLIEQIFDAPVYVSTLDFLPITSDLLSHNLKVLKNILIEEAPPLSAVFLVDKKRKNNFETIFEKTLAESLEKAFHRLLSFDLNSLYSLKGIGFGLTPQGDDLIDGFLAAIYLYERLSAVNTESLRSLIFESSKTSNLISTTFLYFTAHGFFYERFKNVILSVISGNGIEKSVNSMLSFGETSGADILTGFEMGLEVLMEGGMKSLCQ